MIEQTVVSDYNSFWLIIFIFLTIVAIIIGLVIKGKSSDKTHTEIFAKSNDNAKEITVKVTDDYKNMHHDVVEHTLPPVYEKELHCLEKNNKRVIEMLENINNKLDLLIEKTTINNKS